jgi:hypothetical protein
VGKVKFPMRKENKLVKKVKRLIRRLGCPRWLHRFGPKRYEFKDHFSALLIRFFCRLSYRRTTQLLELLGILCPSKSALHYTAKKLGVPFWQRVLKATSCQPYLVALDSTGLSRTNPSYHYLRRIDGGIPKVPIKVSIAFDTRKKKFCAAKIRVLPSHDIKDAEFLLRQSNPQIAVADKAYSSEKLFEFAYQQGITLMIPEKRNARRGFYRKMMAKLFRMRTYHRREMAESGNSSAKRKFGSSVSSRKAKMIRTEVYGRLACHNLFYWLFRDSGLSLIKLNNHDKGSHIWISQRLAITFSSRS